MIRDKDDRSISTVSTIGVLSRVNRTATNRRTRARKQPLMLMSSSATLKDTNDQQQYRQYQQQTSDRNSYGKFSHRNTKFTWIMMNWSPLSVLYRIRIRLGICFLIEIGNVLVLIHIQSRIDLCAQIFVQLSHSLCQRSMMLMGDIWNNQCIIGISSGSR